MKQYLVDQIQHLVEKKEELQNDLKLYVQDKSLPLSDKWEIFCLAGNEGLLPHEGWTLDYNTVDFDKFIADRNRYETLDLGCAVDWFTGRCDNIEDFKEEILDEFIWSFELDW